MGDAGGAAPGRRLIDAPPLPDLLAVAVLALAAFVPAVEGSVAGAGGTAIRMPATVLVLGVHAGTAAIAVGIFGAEASRVPLNLRAVGPAVAGWFLPGALPTVCPGTWLFTRTSPELPVRAPAAFVLGVVA